MDDDNSDYGFIAAKVQNDPEHVQYGNIDFSQPEVLDRQSNRRRRSPIMVEFADPAVSYVDIERAIVAGMNIIKLRMAYSTKSEKIDMLGRVERACIKAGKKQGRIETNTATCATLKTWMIKTGILAEDLTEIPIEKNAEVVLTNALSYIDKTTAKKIFVDYVNLAIDIKVGMEVSFDQGEIIMRCTDILNDTCISCVVTKGGLLKNMQPVSVRNLVHTTPFISQTDIHILKFCCQFEVDMIIVYYVEDALTIVKLKRLLRKAKHVPLVFSAICNQKGLDNLEEIVKECDGILFERELIQFEIDYSKFFRLIQIQKWVAAVCQKEGKPLYLAGGVFKKILATGEVEDSDISDVTNALMNGVTGFVLKECLDIENTIFAINGLNETCCAVEPLTFNKRDFLRLIQEPAIPVNAAEAAMMACMIAANQTESRVIIIPTVTGRTVRGLLLLKPSCIVITVSSQIKVAKSLCTCRNIVPLIYRGPSDKKWYKTMDSRIKYAAHYAVSRSWLTYGDKYVSLQRSSEGNPFCDMVRVWQVSFAKKLLIECPSEVEIGKETEQDDVQASDEKQPKKKKKKKKASKPDDAAVIDNDHNVIAEEGHEIGEALEQDNKETTNEE